MVIWDNVFITGELEETACLASACAAGLSGWGNCMAGNKPPANFGIGMVAIGNKLGIAATPEELSKYYEENLKSKKTVIMKQVNLSEQEQSIIQNALNAYWNDAHFKLDNNGTYTTGGLKLPLGDIEKSLLIQRKKLVKPLLMRFENLY